MSTEDFWDPNTWDLSPQPCKLYLDARAETFLVLDDIDYAWASQWCWHINKPHKSRVGSKCYAVRSQGAGGRTKPRLYLHIEIMKRIGILPSSPEHKWVDHKDSDEFNCRRYNLRWATPSMNGTNRKIIRPIPLFEQNHAQP